MLLRLEFILICIIQLIGCRDTPPKGIRITEEENIRETVFGYQIDLYKEKNKEGIYFLSIGAKKDPTPELIKRFTDSTIIVKPISSTYYDFNYKDKETNKSGMILRVTDILWLKKDKVKVLGGYFVSPVDAYSIDYGLAFADAKWEVVDTISRKGF